MFQEEFNSIAANLSHLQEIDLADIRTIAERYPYCQIAHVIFARKLHDLHSPQFENQLKKAAVNVYDRAVLQQVIERTYFEKTVAAGFEEELAVSVEPELTEEETQKIVEELIESIPDLETPVELAPAITEVPDVMEEKPEPPEEVFIAEEIAQETEVNREPEEIIAEAEQEHKETDAETINTLIEAIPELTEEERVVPEEYSIAGPEEISAELQENMEEETIADAVVDEISAPDTVAEQELNEEETLVELMESIPEIETEPEIIPPVYATDAVEDTGIEMQTEIMEEAVIESAIEAELPVEELVVPELAIEESEIPDIEEEIEAVEENIEEPFFDLPPYDIEHELGILDESEMIRITLERPVPQEETVFETAQSDSFVGWLNRLGSPTKGKLVEQKPANKPINIAERVSGKSVSPSVTEPVQPKVVTESIAADLAKKSLEFDDHLVTETYARILVMQGKYNKAIDMYERLCLLKPQKSDYFAALIDQLKKRIK